MTYYDTMELQHGASADEVKHAFRSLAQKYHPDKPTGSAEKFKKITEAYATLGDPKKRKEYDSRMGIRIVNHPNSGNVPFTGHKSDTFVNQDFSNIFFQEVFVAQSRTMEDIIQQAQARGRNPATVDDLRKEFEKKMGKDFFNKP